MPECRAWCRAEQRNEPTSECQTPFRRIGCRESILGRTDDPPSAAFADAACFIFRPNFNSLLTGCWGRVLPNVPWPATTACGSTPDVRFTRAAPAELGLQLELGRESSGVACQAEPGYDGSKYEAPGTKPREGTRRARAKPSRFVRRTANGDLSLSGETYRGATRGRSPPSPASV